MKLLPDSLLLERHQRSVFLLVVIFLYADLYPSLSMLGTGVCIPQCESIRSFDATKEWAIIDLGFRPEQHSSLDQLDPTSPKKTAGPRHILRSESDRLGPLSSDVGFIAQRIMC